MKAKGLEISGTFARRAGVLQMELSLTNKAMSVMTDFAIQFNRNRYYIHIFIFIYPNYTFLMLLYMLVFEMILTTLSSYPSKFWLSPCWASSGPHSPEPKSDH